MVKKKKKKQKNNIVLQMENVLNDIIHSHLDSQTLWTSCRDGKPVPGGSTEN